MTNTIATQLSHKISELLTQARLQLVQAVNTTMVVTYYQIGQMIVEEEQTGNERADYGKQLIKELSKKLTAEFGKGFSVTNLKQMRQFYLIYSKTNTTIKAIENNTLKSKLIKINTKGQTLSDLSEDKLKAIPNFTLSWSHYTRLMRINDPLERQFYETEAYKNNWSLRELNRQYDSALYTRLAVSKDKEGLLQLATQGQKIEKPQDLIKDPYILEFLALPEQAQYSENDLEQSIIDKLEHFLLELGNGFTTVKLL